MLLAATTALLAAAAGIGVRSTSAGHAAVDEPQYLLSALSLWEDRDLDISDEMAEHRWRAYHDTPLPVQTRVLSGGRQVSPHDPLLPVLLAVPVGLGGWVAAKLAMALIAAATAAATVWLAVRRFGVTARLAGGGTTLAFAGPPLAVYGQQVYPEMPAALAALIGAAALTGQLRRRGCLLLGTSVVALPWLSVKYAPVALALAVLGGLRLLRAGRRRPAAALGLGMAAMGLVYLAVHRAVWGGWTVYASGDHFVATGEFGVVGADPDYAGRTIRLVALLLDAGYGLAAWQPGWLLLVPAVAALLGRRPPGTAVLLVPALTGWLTATWVALTMDGFWWPGRQLVVVLPLLVVAVLAWLSRDGTPRLRVAAGALATAGVLSMLALLLDGRQRQITWVTDFELADDPVHGLLGFLLPDYRHGSGPALWGRHAVWLVALVATAVLYWRRARTGQTARTEQAAWTGQTGPGAATERSPGDPGDPGGDGRQRGQGARRRG